MVEIFKKIAVYAVILLLVFITGCYFFVVFITPKIVNSKTFISNVQDFILDKSGYSFEFSEYNYSVSKRLIFYFAANKVMVKNNDKTVLLFDNLKIKYIPYNLSKSDIITDSIFFDNTNVIKSNKKAKSIDFNNLPQFRVKNLSAVLNNRPQLRINFKNVLSKKDNNCLKVSFEGNIISSFLKNPVILNKNTPIIIKNGNLLFDNFSIYVDKTPLILNGNYKNKSDFNLKINSKNLSVPFIEQTFLYFMKQKEPDNKNFIENFHDFRGLADIDLTIKNKDISGYILLKEFQSKYIKFNIPLHFKNAKFLFDKDRIYLNEDGMVGLEPAQTEFSTENLFSDKRVVKGCLKTYATNNFAKKYIENLSIKNKTDINLNYTVLNKEITVEYLINIPAFSSIIYNNSSLEPFDKKRRIYAKTFKQGNNLYLKTFDYSTLEDDKISSIITGNGLFKRFNNKYHLDFISCKTTTKTPVTIFGFFNNLIKGGYFEGDVRYDANKKIIIGTFDLFNTKYKNFFVKNAKVIADNSNIKVKANGEFENQPYQAFLDLNNTLYDNITINDVNLYLKQFTIKKGKHNKNQLSKEYIANKVKEANLTIKNGKIRLDKLIFKKIILENLELTGQIDDNIAYFNVPDIDFAKGKLSAEGVYDLEYKASNINFYAKCIDSNLASDMIFNLKNQFEGLSNAELYFKSYDSLNFIDAFGKFSIQDGALTKLGSREFLVKKSKDSKKMFKFKLTDILNIKEEKIKALRSNLNGNFELKNTFIKNAEIYSKHKYLSMYLRGNYEIKSQKADVKLFGNYNKNAQKGIRVLFIPLSWITKFVFKNEDLKSNYIEQINKIPPIEGKDIDKEIFVVKLSGNPNNNSSIKVEMNGLK